MKKEIVEYDYFFKIIFLGESGVGKSNILLRGSRGEAYEFNNYHQTTIGIEYAYKIMHTAKGKCIKFQMWDTAGQ